MKKNIIILLIITAVFSFSFMGCSSKSAEPENPIIILDLKLSELQAKLKRHSILLDKMTELKEKRDKLKAKQMLTEQALDEFDIIYTDTFSKCIKFYFLHHEGILKLSKEKYNEVEIERMNQLNDQIQESANQIERILTVTNE